MENEPPTPFLTNLENISININQDNKDYLLNIEFNDIKGENINIIVYDSNELDSSYSLKMSFNQIKELHQLFMGISSCLEFCEYIKALSKNNKITIINKDSTIFISIEIEYLFKKNFIELKLIKEKPSKELIMKNICKEIKLIKEKMNLENEKLRDENNELKKDIQNLKKENIILKEEIKVIKNKLFPNKEIHNKENIIFKSLSLKENELDFVISVITAKFDKEIKEIKNLYQASIDGDNITNFHSRCDNISNTLVLIKSAGNKTFGGFTSQTWESKEEGVFKDDKYAFLFSIDKQKIYKYKNDGKAIYVTKYFGPTFGNNTSLYIGDKAISTKNSFTNESDKNSSYDFNGDTHALSEDGKISRIFLIDYAVFQIIFN